jgi:hypothetical protein
LVLFDFQFSNSCSLVLMCFCANLLMHVHPVQSRSSRPALSPSQGEP